MSEKSQKKPSYKGSAISPPNIAFSKYWGKTNHELVLPANDSISMTLGSIYSHTTVEFSPQYDQDLVEIGDQNHSPQPVAGSKKTRVTTHLARFRKLASIELKAKVVSQNNFPLGAGIASSASAFSALTAACIAALGLQVSKKRQSILTRLAGSGSATRSVFGGFVRWQKGRESNQSYAYQLFPADYWALADVVLVISNQEKKFSSLQGHSASAQSSLTNARVRQTKLDNQGLEQALAQKNFAALGKIIEKQMYLLHAVAMTSNPAILYWQPGTVWVLQQVQRLRQQGVQVYATLDAGPNPHLIVEQVNAHRVIEYFKNSQYVQDYFCCPVGRGTRFTSKHLF